MTLGDLQKATRDVSLISRGDQKEQGAANLIQAQFPEYEEFWRLFVYPYRSGNSVLLNLGLPRSHETVCIYNYSVFRSVIRVHEFVMEARKKKDTEGDTSSETFEDFFIRLGIAYSQIRQFAGAVYVAFVEKKDGKDRSIKSWDKKRACHYKWLEDSINSSVGQQIEKERELDHFYRNIIAHGHKLAGYRDKVPKPDYVSDLAYWSEWRSLLESKLDERDEKTITRIELMETRQKIFVDVLNSFWRDTRLALLKEGQDSAPPNEQLVNLQHKKKWDLYENIAVISSSDPNPRLLPPEEWR